MTRIDLACALLVLAGCAGEHEVPPPELASCRSNWDEVLPLDTGLASMPQVLRLHDGVLYYDSYDHDEHAYHIMALPETGGTPKAITDQIGFRSLWIEDERVLFALNDELFAAPLSGGPAEVVAGGETFGFDQVIKQGLLLSAHALDADYLYFTVMSYVSDADNESHQETRVWRTPRAGGGAEELALLPSEDLFEDLFLLSDQLVPVGISGEAFTVPKDGGKPEKLAAPGGVTFAGMGTSGVIRHLRHADANGEHAWTELLLSKPGHSKAEPFWSDKPHSVDPGYVWQDAAGDSVIDARERFSDGKYHLTIWSLDHEGIARRIACDRRGDLDTGAVPLAVLSEDAAYLVVDYLGDLDGDPSTIESGWKLVRVKRP